MERGEVRNRNYYNQVRDFSGMRWGNITPTDIDGGMDFHNELTIYLELKYGDKEVPLGQRLFLERQNDDIQRGGKCCLTLICSHNTPPEKDIDVSKCLMIEYRYNYKWRKPSRINTVREAIDKLLRWKEIYIEENRA